MADNGKPTGARPMPKIPGNASHTTPHMNATRPAAKHTSMPSPKRAATSKKKGGRSY